MAVATGQNLPEPNEMGNAAKEHPLSAEFCPKCEQKQVTERNPQTQGCILRNENDSQEGSQFIQGEHARLGIPRRGTKHALAGP